MIPIVSTSAAILAGICERIAHHIERVLAWTGKEREL